MSRYMSYAAIVVRYLPATACKGSRMKATCQAGSLTESYDHAENDGGAANVARKLAEKLGWSGDYVMGMIPSGERVFVRAAEAGTLPKGLTVYTIRESA